MHSPTTVAPPAGRDRRGAAASGVQLRMMSAARMNGSSGRCEDSARRAWRTASWMFCARYACTGCFFVNSASPPRSAGASSAVSLVKARGMGAAGGLAADEEMGGGSAGAPSASPSSGPTSAAYSSPSSPSTYSPSSPPSPPPPISALIAATSARAAFPLCAA